MKAIDGMAARIGEAAAHGWKPRQATIGADGDYVHLRPRDGESATAFGQRAIGAYGLLDGERVCVRLVRAGDEMALWHSNG